MTEDTQEVTEPTAEAEEPAGEAAAEPVVETAPEAPAAVEGESAGEGEVVEGEVVDGEAAPAVPEEPIEIGAVIFVTVQRITPYGAFVVLSDGRSGLIHISEIDRNYVKDVREHLRESDRVEAKVMSIKDDGKIDLSIKALQDPQPRVRRGSDPEFEQKLRKFMRSSEERQVDVKRSVMKKRK